MHLGIHRYTLVMEASGHHLCILPLPWPGILSSPEKELVHVIIFNYFMLEVLYPALLFACFSDLWRHEVTHILIISSIKQFYV